MSGTKRRAEVPRAARDGPIVRAPQPKPAAEGSLAYRPAAPAPARIAVERLPCRFGPTATEPCLRCGSDETLLNYNERICLVCKHRWPVDPPAISTVAAALCLSPDDFARDALVLLAHVGPSAYLRLLRDKDPAAWRERILVILTATGGNFSQAAARVGLTYRGLLKAIISDPKLQQEISERWPARHERGLVR